MQLTHPVRWACDSERVVGRTEIGFRSHLAGRGRVMNDSEALPRGLRLVSGRVLGAEPCTQFLARTKPSRLGSLSRAGNYRDPGGKNWAQAHRIRITIANSDPQRGTPRSRFHRDRHAGL